MKLEMWADAQSDVRPAEHRWRPLFNTTVPGSRYDVIQSEPASSTRRPCFGEAVEEISVDVGLSVA